MATIGWSAGLTIDGDPIGEAVRITLPSPDIAEIESTHLGSTGKAREYIPGLQDASEYSFEANYSASLYTQLQGYGDDVLEHVVYSPAAENQTFSFDAFVKKLELAFEPDAVSKITVTCKVTGPVTLGTGAIT